MDCPAQVATGGRLLSPATNRNTGEYSASEWPPSGNKDQRKCCDSIKTKQVGSKTIELQDLKLLTFPCSLRPQRELQAVPLCPPPGGKEGMEPEMDLPPSQLFPSPSSSALTLVNTLTLIFWIKPAAAINSSRKRNRRGAWAAGTASAQKHPRTQLSLPVVSISVPTSQESDTGDFQATDPTCPPYT